MRAIRIDSGTRTVTETENTGLESLQAVVGGYITFAHELPDGHTLYVNDDGLNDFDHAATGWFTIDGGHQPFIGNGVLVGPADDDGETTAATVTVEALRGMIQFLTLAHVRAQYLGEQTGARS